MDGKWRRGAATCGVNPFWNAGVRHGAMVEHAMNVPTRAVELQLTKLTLPDPVILTGILGKYGDALGKLGGMQLSYRIAAVRQELAVDVCPTILAVEQYAEHFQSEAEELCLGLGLKATPNCEGQNLWQQLPLGAQHQRLQRGLVAFGRPRKGAKEAQHAPSCTTKWR
jgi:hypothetical protein